jgi:integrase
VRVSVVGDRAVTEFGVSGVGGAGPWELVLRLCRAGPAGPARAAAPWRLPDPARGIAARDTLLGDGDTVTAEGWTMQRCTRTRIRPTTLRSYEVHVERHLIPHLGRVRLSELTGRHITEMITAIGATTNRYGRTPTPSTLHRIRATLRSALNAAIREGLLRDNPARYVEVPSPRRPHALVWTAQRVEAWQKTGERPAVAVWTVEQTATFLSYLAQDRLAVMWWLIALRGLRRGEAAGLRWADVDLDAGVAMIEQQRIANGRAVTVGPPKTAASRRLVALDRHTIRLLRADIGAGSAPSNARRARRGRTPATCS